MSGAGLSPRAAAADGAARGPVFAGRGESLRDRQVDSAEDLSALGALRLRRGELEGAVEVLRRAIALRPGEAADHLHLGIALRALGRLDEAIASARRARELAPELAAARHNLGNALRAAGRIEEAERELRCALELAPGDPRTASSLAALLLDRHAVEEAGALLAAAAAADPSDPGVAFNRSVALRRLGRDAEAIVELRRAVDLAPGGWRPRLELAHLLLRRGDWAEGSRLYDWRFDHRGDPAPRAGRPQPVWDGGPLAGRTLLTGAEQGAGDLIQFVRLVPRLAELGARVVVKARPALAGLIATCPGIAGVVAPDAPCAEADLQIPLLSVPRRLGLTPDTVRRHRGPYLTAPDRPAPGLDHLLRPAGLRVGVSWAGDPANPLDPYRSCDPALLAPLAGVPGIRLYSLQFRDAGLPAERVARWGIHSLGPLLGDFQSAATAIARLDLVITVDTAVAHLAGALGRPVWTLLHHDPDWRWGRRGSTTCWYPTMRLWRQTSPGDWAEVLGRVARRLRTGSHDAR